MVRRKGATQQQYVTTYEIWYPDKNQNATGQNATMSKTDKMPQCKWCNKDTAEVLQGCNKSVTGV